MAVQVRLEAPDQAQCARGGTGRRAALRMRCPRDVGVQLSPRVPSFLGCSSVRRERPVRNREARGSSPRAPTISQGYDRRHGADEDKPGDRPKGRRSHTLPRRKTSTHASPGRPARGRRRRGGRRDDRDAVRKDARRLDAKAGRPRRGSHPRRVTPTDPPRMANGWQEESDASRRRAACSARGTGLRHGIPKRGSVARKAKGIWRVVCRGLKPRRDGVGTSGWVAQLESELGP